VLLREQVAGHADARAVLAGQVRWSPCRPKEGACLRPVGGPAGTGWTPAPCLRWNPRKFPGVEAAHGGHTVCSPVVSASP